MLRPLVAAREHRFLPAEKLVELVGLFLPYRVAIDLEAPHLEYQPVVSVEGCAPFEDLNHGLVEVPAPVGSGTVGVLKSVFLGQGPVGNWITR